MSGDRIIDHGGVLKDNYRHLFPPGVPIDYRYPPDRRGAGIRLVRPPRRTVRAHRRGNLVIGWRVNGRFFHAVGWPERFGGRKRWMHG